MPDGQKLRATTTQKIRDQDAANHQNIKMLLSLGERSDGEAAFEEILSYNEVADLVERQMQAEIEVTRISTIPLRSSSVIKARLHRTMRITSVRRTTCL
jgi:hypothetical protein